MSKPLRYRFEAFGGIISIESPPMLAFVDRDCMRELGLGESPEWKKKRNYLSAPTEVHFSVTNACPVKCRHCYMDSGDCRQDELDLNSCRKVLDSLSGMGVFHVALGGGEAFSRRDFFSIAKYARKVGIVPNLTTNGYYVNEIIAEKCRIFGQVNISINSLDEENFSMADSAVRRLKKAGVKTGVNCMVSSLNYNRLDEVFKYASRHGLHDVELLRFKPSGRGRELYYKMKLNDRQNRSFFPHVMRISEKHGVPVKIDCSFIPMICFHNPDRSEMEKYAVYGCYAGDVLLSIFSDGRFAGCSFASHGRKKWEGDVKRLWHDSRSMKRFRNWVRNAPSPCRECGYLEICRGGCHVIAEFETGDFNSPDPDCPIISKKPYSGDK